MAAMSTTTIIQHFYYNILCTFSAYFFQSYLFIEAYSSLQRHMSIVKYAYVSTVHSESIQTSSLFFIFCYVAASC